MVVASPGNLCKINLNKRQRLRHFLNHKGIRSRFKCTSQSCAYELFEHQVYHKKTKAHHYGTLILQTQQNYTIRSGRSGASNEIF